MKKLLVLALAVVLVLSFASISMASAVFSGEIRTGIKADNSSGDSASNDYAYGKMTLTGKLGDDLTGTLVYLADDISSIKVDEADVTFTEDWGSVKLGYYGWNNNVKDILDTYVSDIKSQTVVSVAFPLTDSLKLGLAYAFTSDTYQVVDNWYNEHNALGADLGWASDNIGVDFLYFNYGDMATVAATDKFDTGSNTAWGVNAYIKLGDIKPYVQYRSISYGSDKNGDSTLSSAILGLTYEPAAAPIYLRAEVNVANEGIAKNPSFYVKDTYDSTPWGFRIGYKLADGATVEAQYKASGFNNSKDVAGSEYYVKLMCPF